MASPNSASFILKQALQNLDVLVAGQEAAPEDTQTAIEVFILMVRRLCEEEYLKESDVSFGTNALLAAAGQPIEDGAGNQIMTDYAENVEEVSVKNDIVGYVSDVLTADLLLKYPVSPTRANIVLGRAQRSLGKLRVRFFSDVDFSKLANYGNLEGLIAYGAPAEATDYGE